MSNDQPGPEGQEPDRPGQGQNPFAGTPFEALFGMSGMGGTGSGGSGGSDPDAMFQQLRRMQGMLSWEGGPINWELAKDMAGVTIREAGDASLTAAERAEVGDSVRLAEHWLDEVTELPASSAGAVAWNRAEWLENTLPTWRKLVDPLATHIVGAMSGALPDEAREMAGPFGDLMTKAGGLMFGVQVGQGLGRLATEVLGATDVGVALGTPGIPALVPANIAAFGEGLEVSESDVRLFLALRECAHQRLVHHAPWLVGHLTSAVEEYARGMQVDFSKLEGTMGQVDPSNPEALQDILNSGVLMPEETPAQKSALARLETALALVEGWIEDLVMQAADPRMPSARQLHEAVRRRRAEGGPAEQTFATLVGLELRPRRLRDAAALWAALRESGGATERDALWAHPDLLPGSDDLDDPIGFAEHHGSAATFDLGTFTDLAEAGDQRAAEGDSETEGTDDGSAGTDGAGSNDGPDDGPDGPPHGGRPE